MEPLLRLGVLALLALLVAGGYLLLRRRNARTLRQVQAGALLHELVVPGTPTVIAFSAPGCVVCRAQQTPALDQLAVRVGAAVGIRCLAAPEHPDVVERLGILTVPATVVLDAHGRVQHINHGFADAVRLHAQLQPFIGAVLP
jgi:thioredoxin-like negative regulator of GroEL